MRKRRRKKKNRKRTKKRKRKKKRKEKKRRERSRRGGRRGRRKRRRGRRKRRRGRRRGRRRVKQSSPLTMELIGCPETGVLTTHQHHVTCQKSEDLRCTADSRQFWYIGHSTPIPIMYSTIPVLFHSSINTVWYNICPIQTSHCIKGQNLTPHLKIRKKKKGS